MGFPLLRMVFDVYIYMYILVRMDDRLAGESGRVRWKDSKRDSIPRIGGYHQYLSPSGYKAGGK